jgi:hypothetical protein
MPLYKSLIFLFLLLDTSSLILPFKYSLSFFLNIQMFSRLKFWKSILLIWFGILTIVILTSCIGLLNLSTLEDPLCKSIVLWENLGVPWIS